MPSSHTRWGALWIVEPFSGYVRGIFVVISTCVKTPQGLPLIVKVYYLYLYVHYCKVTKIQQGQNEAFSPKERFVT